MRVVGPVLAVFPVFPVFPVLAMFAMFAVLPVFPMLAVMVAVAMLAVLAMTMFAPVLPHLPARLDLGDGHVLASLRREPLEERLIRDNVGHLRRLAWLVPLNPCSLHALPIRGGGNNDLDVCSLHSGIVDIVPRGGAALTFRAAVAASGNIPGGGGSRSGGMLMIVVLGRYRWSTGIPVYPCRMRGGGTLRGTRSLAVIR